MLTFHRDKFLHVVERLSAWILSTHPPVAHAPSSCICKGENAGEEGERIHEEFKEQSGRANSVRRSSVMQHATSSIPQIYTCPPSQNPLSPNLNA